MKFLPLIWYGLWRKPGRTVLIFLQVCVAFALFGVLQGLKTGVEHAINDTRADLLIVHSRLGLADSLPLGGIGQIKSVPGVKVVEPVGLFGATYQKPAQRVGVVAITPDRDWLAAFTFSVAPEYVEAFRKLRTGALVRVELARKYGWKVGDHIPLMGGPAQMNGSTAWVVDVVGTFTDTDVGSSGDVLMINYAYFDEARLLGKGTVSHFKVLIADPRLAVTVSDEIDRRFANSANETRSESMRELAQAQMQSIGDLNFLIRAVIGAVLVALLFATATMMMQSTRERTPELAVLKTLGFTDGTVFVLLLAESIAVFITAAGCGLALAMLVFPFASRVVPGLAMPMIVIAIGLTAAVLVAAISAAVPATVAARLNIVTALTTR
ncbi:MAG: ABC transporter permease [Steroidobacteraceae bacterium]